MGEGRGGGGLCSGLYLVEQADSGVVKRDFKDVTADGVVYCYGTRDRFETEPLPFVILVQLTSATTVRSERQDAASCGSGPWQFSSAYTDFER